MRLVEHHPSPRQREWRRNPPAAASSTAAVTTTAAAAAAAAKVRREHSVCGEHDVVGRLVRVKG